MKFCPTKVKFGVDVREEELSVRGNAMASGDDDYDRNVEDKILEDLESGNVWAWCEVTVIASYEGIDGVFGYDHIGGCSYMDEQDFRSCDYFQDMKERAKIELRTKLEAIFKELS